MLMLLPVFAALIVLLDRADDYQAFIHRNLPINKRRGTSVVWALFTLGLVIVVGTVVFAKVFPKLDDLRDTTFTADANATITGVSVDFYDGVDLLRIALVIVPIVAILGYVYMMRQQ